MISIIVSVYRSHIFENFVKSVEETIGVSYEIIPIENFKGQIGICDVYNKGAMLSKYPYLCFVHEDVIFNTQDWGMKLVGVFEHDKTVGLLGIAGSKYKSLCPSAWFNFGFEQFDFRYLIQHFPGPKEPKLENSFVSLIDSTVEVETIDGVFLFTTKGVWLESKFDGDSFKGFHCYDIDFSLKVRLKYKVYVTNLILLEHLSLGSLNAEWIADTLILSKKWRNQLPKGNIPNSFKKRIEVSNRTIFIKLMLDYNFSMNQIVGVLINYASLRYFSFLNSVKLVSYILKKRLYRNDI